MMRQGHLPMVIQLMRYGADPSIADGEGYRALHLAILFQHMAIAAYLMAKGQVSLHTHTHRQIVFFLFHVSHHPFLIASVEAIFHFVYSIFFIFHVINDLLCLFLTGSRWA